MRGSLVLLLLLLAAPAAHAAGVNFAWEKCLPEGGTSLHYFACDTNVTSPVAVAVASFMPSVDRPAFVGFEAVVDLKSTTDALPDWWQFFNPGSCREQSLSVSADFGASPHTQCADPFGGPTRGGIAGYLTSTTIPPAPYGPPAYERLKCAFATDDVRPVLNGVEYFAFTIRIDGGHSTGAGACAGCNVPVCLLLTEIKVVENTGPYERLSHPIQNQLIGWQCGQGSASHDLWGQAWLNTCATHGAPCFTPARNRTWGGIKALYR